MCIIDSYILYNTTKCKRNENPSSQLKYRKLLLDQLVGNFRMKWTRVSPSSSETRLDRKLHIASKDDKRDCTDRSKRAKKSGRRQTSEYCDTCPNKPRIHIGECFKRYHNNVNFKM